MTGWVTAAGPPGAAPMVGSRPAVYVTFSMPIVREPAVSGEFRLRRVMMSDNNDRVHVETVKPVEAPLQKHEAFLPELIQVDRLVRATEASLHPSPAST